MACEDLEAGLHACTRKHVNGMETTEWRGTNRTEVPQASEDVLVRRQEAVALRRLRVCHLCGVSGAL